jgi:hypothetical protein
MRRVDLPQGRFGIPKAEVRHGVNTSTRTAFEWPTIHSELIALLETRACGQYEHRSGASDLFRLNALVRSLRLLDERDPTVGIFPEPE